MDDAEWYIDRLQARLNRLRDTADDFLRQAEDLRRENRRLLAENAHREGWLNTEASLAAEYVGTAVRVTATRGKTVVQKTYTRDDRWSYLLLRDLVWGTYRN
jgi:hypothetical protein